MKVEDILVHKGNDVISVDKSATLGEAAQILEAHNIGAVLVTGKGKAPEGILSERDIVRQVARAGPDALSRAVGACMTSDVRSCASGDSIDDIMGLMTNHRIRHMPVVDQGTVIGMISIGDVVKRKINHAEQEAEALKAYIAT